MRNSGTANSGAARRLAMLGAAGLAVLVGGCGGGSTSPSHPTLTATSATVQAALNTYTSGTVGIPVSCSGGIAINCPGGTAGSATQVTLTRSGLNITQAAQDSFAYAMDLGIVTQSPFTVSSSGIDCGVSVNTAAGSSPVVHVAGTAKFTSQTPNGPIDEVDLTTALTGAEAEDLTITGPTNCQILASSIALFEGAFVVALTNGTTRLCAASGGHFTTCS